MASNERKRVGATQGHSIARELCEALGLPPGQVRGFELRVYPMEIVTAVVEFMPDRAGMERVAEILKHFRLVEVNSYESL